MATGLLRRARAAAPGLAAEAQAQVTTQTAIGAVYQMPLGMDLSDAGASTQVFHTLIPIGDAGLAQIKNQSAAAVQRLAEEPSRKFLSKEILDPV